MSDVTRARKEALARNKKFDNNRSREQKTTNSKKSILNYNTQIFVTNAAIIKLQGYITDYEKIISQRMTRYYAKRKEYLANDGVISPSENDDLLDNPSYGIGRDSKSGTASFQTAITNWKKEIKTNEEKITSYQKKIAELQNVLLGNKPTPPKKPDTPGGISAAVTTDGNATFSKDWKYNPPMVKSAYFTSASGVSKSLVGITNDGNYVDAGKYQDALTAWSNTTGARGTLQMDRKYVNTISQSQNNTVALDPQMYGFKFLYNPKEVAMSWNQLMAMDPPFEASGQDAYSIVSATLIASTVEVTLLLNRIGDFAYINENGYNPGFGTTDLSPDAVIERIRQTGASSVNNPYPDNVSLDDIKEIYKKGTMYDLEYLFKTINGPHATFISQLNGKTADRGWIRPTFVELHLGDGMHYRVRVRDLSVTHSIFNSRMVPILSSVHLVLGRFNDGPQTYTEAHPAYGTNNTPLYQPGGTKLP
jgi:hypothetical protein